MATPVLDIGVMLTNLQAAFSNLTSLVVAVSYVTGIALVFRGIAMYRAFGQHITQTSQRGEVAGPMVFLVVGAILIYLPSTLDIGLNTVFDSTQLGAATDLLAYASSTQNAAQYEELATVLVSYLKLLGLIAFVRGWIILSKMGHQGAQPGSFGKGLTHLIAGILLVNIVDTIRVLANTFGFTGFTG